MHLFGSSDYSGELAEDCNEGTLAWISEEDVLKMPTWEGDRLFLTRMLAGEQDIELTLRYEGDRLVFWSEP